LIELDGIEDGNGRGRCKGSRKSLCRKEERGGRESKRKKIKTQTSHKQSERLSLYALSGTGGLGSEA
jgi:hypothetical protein